MSITYTNFTFDEKSIIDVGTMVSPYYNISCLTSGAYNRHIGRWSPIFRSDMAFHDRSHDAVKVIPKWQIANNLANLCTLILDPLFLAFRSRLIISNVYSSLHKFNFITDESRHLIGSAVDLTFAGSVEDCYADAVKAYNLVGASSVAFRLVYGQTSWLHIAVQPIHDSPPIGEKDFGVNTIDLITGEKLDGLQKIRGPLGDDWFLDEPEDPNPVQGEFGLVPPTTS